MTIAGESRIYEGGYRRYDGPRLGPSHAFWSLWRHTVQRILGLRRPARHKILPVLSALIAYLPPAVFVGLAAFLPDELAEDALPSYGEIYGTISAAIVLFVVFVAPEALCPDRRSNVLSLYLASPLTRDQYLLAKAAAVFSTLMIVTLGPPLLLLIGLSLEGSGPDGIDDLALTLVRILGAGVVMSAVYTALSLGVASVTDRRAWAAASTFVFINITNIVGGILVFALELPDWVFMISLFQVPFEAAQRIHGEIRPGTRGDDDILQVATAAVFVGCALWTAAGLGLAWWRYRRLQVTR